VLVFDLAYAGTPGKSIASPQARVPCGPAGERAAALPGLLLGPRPERQEPDTLTWAPGAPNCYPRRGIARLLARGVQF